MLTRQQGGTFFFQPAAPEAVMAPEALSGEQREIARTTRDFATRAVYPQQAALERHEWDVSRALLRQAGELGLTAAEVPESFEGLELDKVTATVIAQELAAGGASFALTFNVDTGIGALPIVYFGTPDQKARYLPGIASGERVAAYALTEPGAGSDALSGRTTARLSEDGRHYILNGTKQWITNASFADLYVLYARIDGEQFTAFLVERGFPGVSTGREEEKMGYWGSSTAQVILEDARVPVENLLHFPGRGHQVAFNTLNLGRFKLAPLCLGSCITLIGLATRYAQERQQFGRPVASFPLIGRKLADMATRTYALESVTYRLAGLIDEATAGLDLAGDAREEAVAALGEYAIECSIAKVLATETLSVVADEAVQIHGGNGFMRDYDVERAYRDNRVNRIFEGTNEINRLLIPTMLFRRAQQGLLPQLAGIEEEQARLWARGGGPEGDGPLAREWWLLAVARALFWQVAGATRRRFAVLDEEQELLALLGDLGIGIFAIESTLARTERLLAGRGVERAALAVALAQAATYDLFGALAGRGREGLIALADDAPSALARLDALANIAPLDRLATGRRIAAAVQSASGWPLGG